MPSELRHLLFRPDEVVQAVWAYHRRLGLPVPSGVVARCGPEDRRGNEVVFRITFVPAPAKDAAARAAGAGGRCDVLIDGPTLTAALILHCRDRRIPLPARVAKTLRRYGERVCLVSAMDPEWDGLGAPGSWGPG